jgi:D-glycero-D-manno-heptose 1,7-bisphosphate phosphatase
MNKAAFLDRDGVINQNAPNGGYTTCWEDFHFLPGVAEAIALLNRANYLVIVVTNQRGVAKGLLTIATLEEIHNKMTAQLAAAGARIDAIYYCPHGSDQPCACRKPAPGMLLDAAKAHHIDLPNSWMIGDSVSDIEAGRQAGCKTILISSTPESSEPTIAADLPAYSLHDAVNKLLSLTPPG